MVAIAKAGGNRSVRPMSPEPLLSMRSTLIVLMALVIGLVMGFLAWQATPTKLAQAVMIGLGAGAAALVGLQDLVGPT